MKTYLVLRCQETDEMFIINFIERDSEWYITGAYKVQKNGVVIVTDGATVTTTVDFSQLNYNSYDGCPWCGNKGFFRCGGCENLECDPGGDTAYCQNCEEHKSINGTIEEITTKVDSGGTGITSQ